MFLKRLISLLGTIVIIFCISSCSSNEEGSSNEEVEESYNLPLLLSDASVNQESRINMMKAQAIKENNGYLDTDEVSLIIELDSESLIDEYINVYSTKYQSVAEYAASPEGIKKANAINKEPSNINIDTFPYALLSLSTLPLVTIFLVTESID